MRFITRQVWVRALSLTAVLFIAAHTAWAQPQNYYTGDGGKSVRIAVLEPTGKGLSDDERWMLSLVQGSITGDFNKYSAMTVIDRQNLEKVLKEWEEATSDNYSDADRIKIGNLTNASHILTGSITKTPDAFMLELSVTDAASGVRRASYSPTPISPMALQNLSAVKAASADLLRQLGVELTAAARSELGQAANLTQIQAQTALSRGIAAQRRGTEVAALSYFYQAASFDPSLFEASNRSSVMAANISSGNLGADVRNDIVWRKNWVARLAETEETFYNIVKSVDPPYTLVYSTGVEKKRTDYQKETADLSVPINMVANLSWFKAMDRSLQAVQTVLNGLNGTNRRNEWGLSGWPRWNGVTSTNPFDKWKTYNIEIAFELVNQQGRVIGSRTVKLSPSFMITNNNDRFVVSFDDNTSSAVEFNGVNANDITDDLTIRVASINGKPPQTTRLTITAISAEKRKEYLVWRMEKGVVMGFSHSLTEAQRAQHRDLVIPSEVWGQPVTGVGGRSFNNIGLNSVRISDGVTSIGNEAFANNYITDAIIPNSVTSIGDYAFANNRLDKVTIPKGVEVIKENAFAGNQLTEITINANYVTIGSNALPDAFVASYVRNDKKADTYYSFYYNHRSGWENAAERARRPVEEEKEEERRIVNMETKVDGERIRHTTEANTYTAFVAEFERMKKRPIRFGWRSLGVDVAYTAGGSSSEWFNINYPGYNDIGLSNKGNIGVNLGTGIMLNIRISNRLVLAGEWNYAYLWNEYQYMATESDFAIAIETSNNTMNVPMLLRIRGKGSSPGYFDIGYQYGFPVNSKAKVRSGGEFPYNKIRDTKEVSEIRVEKDQGVVVGFGVDGPYGIFGFRFVYHLTKWDKDGNFKAPFTMGFTFGLYFL